MEKSQKISRKRKQLSSSSINTPFSGVLTRQKSQKFFCSRNRSGKSRQCRSIQRSFAELPAKKSTLIDVDFDRGGSGRVEVKDLRARRVFSKPLKKSGFDSDELIDCKVDCFDLNDGKPRISIDVGNPNFSVLRKCSSNLTAGESILSKEFDDCGVNLTVEDLAGENPNFSAVSENPNSIALRESGDDSGANLSAERLIVETIKSSEKCDSMVDCNEKIAEIVDDMNPNLSVDFAEGGIAENCVVKDEENVQTTPPDAVFSVRKSDEQNRLMSRNCVSRSLSKQISPSNDGSSTVKEMTLSKCSRRKIFKVPNSFTYKRLLPYLMDMAKDEPYTSTDYTSAKIEVDVPKSPEKPLAVVAACVPQVVSIDENNERPSDAAASTTADVSPDKVAATFDSHSPMNVDEMSKEDTSFEHGIVDVELKREGGLICTPHSSNSLATPDAAVGGMTKGILKRNPFGCRGICSCLNCSSFRLNAEKAFEFSTNQLLGAKEVAQDLMKELSNLRCVLKKSVAGVTEGGAVTLNQVEEACQRASNVEDVANARLRQMQEDLFVHSRTKALQRPRVNFSSNVQEGITEELTNQNDIAGVVTSSNLS